MKYHFLFSFTLFLIFKAIFCGRTNAYQSITTRVSLLFPFTIFLFSFSFSQESYKDSVQQLRILHTSELLDPNNKILSDEEIDHFEGLDYYLIDPTIIISAKFEYNLGKKFKMPTSSDRTPIYRRYGYVYFEIAGEACTLTVYQNMEFRKKKGFEDYLFIPFRDASSGVETYGGGRYLDLKIPNSETLIIDFNLAYNPYCAYSAHFSCPIPPAENTLKVSVEAGEKTPLGH